MRFVKSINKKRAVKSIFILISIIVFFGILKIEKEISKAEAYSCKTGFECSSDGGVVYGAYWSKCVEWDSETGRYVSDDCCKIGTRSYSCSGTDANCNGGKDYYKTLADCWADPDGSDALGAGCCDKITCVSTGCQCTPASCSSGYTESASATTCDTYNSSTTVTKKCTGTDNCGKACSDSRTCYLLEANFSFSQADGSTDGPESISMTVDGVSYQLSTDPNNPTHIKKPSKNSTNVQVSVPSFTAPDTSAGEQYYFQADNYGVSDIWEGGTSCTGVAGEDFCITSSSSSVNFVPSSTSQTVSIVLTDSAEGKISGTYQTKDLCDSSSQSSTTITGYYVVDTIPTTPGADILPEIGSDITTRGCTSSEYSGTEINNPLHVVASSSDANNNDEIQSLIIWLSKDTTVPSTTNLTSTYDGGTLTDIGIMIKKNGSTWENPLIYSTTTSSNWSEISDGYVKIGAINIIKITDLSITQETGVTFDFNLQFLPTTSNLYGKYNLYSTVLDSYMINGGIIDQSYLTKLMTWGIDVVSPTVDDTTQTVKDANNIYISWTADDDSNGSGLVRIVLNGYHTGGVDSELELFAPTKYIYSRGIVTTTTVPAENLIGLIDDFNSWQFISSADSESVSKETWMDKNWIYRKGITVSNNYSSARTNEDVLVTIDTATLISEGKLQNDCDDLRFIDSDDIDSLVYWVEGGCNTSQTNVWVRIPSLPADGKLIYVYYGNSTASNAEEDWTGSFIMLSDSTCPTGWSLDTNFVNKFALSSSTYGTTGGSSTHNHSGSLSKTLSTVSGKVTIPAGTTGTITAALSTHTHTYTYISSESNYPPYLTMLYCKSNELANTSGLITTTSGSSQNSWTRFTALDGKFALGGTTYGATGGSATHTHIFTGASSDTVLSTFNYKVGTTARTVSTSHTHALNITATTVSNLPPYVNAIFKVIPATDANYAGMTSMVTSTPPLGWSKSMLSQIGNYFVSSSTRTTDLKTILLIGWGGLGSSTHTHVLTTKSPSLSSGGDTTIYVGSATTTKSFASTHTHAVSTTSVTTTADSNYPPYTTVAYAYRKISQAAVLGVEQTKGETLKYVKVTSLSSVTSLINIGDEESGKINMYVTAYDRACNSSAKSEDINLNAWWIATRGGVVYSKGSITSETRDVTTSTSLDNVLTTMTKEQIDLGTELLSSRNASISNLIHTKVTSTQTGEEVSGAVKATNVYDSNNTKNYWFNNLLTKAKTQEDSLTKFSISSGDTKVSDSCSGNYCYMYSESDINIPNGYSCNKPTLFMTTGDINIEPNITSTKSALAGCIFVAQEDINIGAGTYYSDAITSTVGYDYIEGFFIADNQVTFTLVDQEYLLRDGIEILGSIVALGSDVTSTDSAINIKRNLKAFNQTNPAVVITYDTKYSEISTIFFGTEAPIYKQEVGFKNF